MLETGKLYFVKDHSTATNERSVIMELKGTVAIYGSMEDADTLNSLSDLTQYTEDMSDFAQTLSGLPKYVAFIGSATRINIQDRDFEYIKDIS